MSHRLANSTHVLTILRNHCEVVPKQTRNQTVRSYSKPCGPPAPKHPTETPPVDSYPQTIYLYYYDKKIKFMFFKKNTYILVKNQNYYNNYIFQECDEKNGSKQ